VRDEERGGGEGGNDEGYGVEALGGMGGEPGAVGADEAEGGREEGGVVWLWWRDGRVGRGRRGKTSENGGREKVLKVACQRQWWSIFVRQSFRQTWTERYDLPECVQREQRRFEVFESVENGRKRRVENLLRGEGDEGANEGIPEDEKAVLKSIGEGCRAVKPEGVSDVWVRRKGTMSVCVQAKARLFPAPSDGKYDEKQELKATHLSATR
jgi:hypothetical protein